MNEVFYIASVLVVRSSVLPKLFYYVSTNCGVFVYDRDNVPRMVKNFIEKNMAHVLPITPYAAFISCGCIDDLRGCNNG